MVINKQLCVFYKGKKIAMEGVDLIEENEVHIEGNKESGCDDVSFSDLIEEKGGDSSASSSEMTGNELEEKKSQSSDGEDESSTPSMGWPVQEVAASDCASPHGSEDGEKKHMENKEFEKQVSAALPGIH